jgi:hypothetical protein
LAPTARKMKAEDDEGKLENKFDKIIGQSKCIFQDLKSRIPSF